MLILGAYGHEDVRFDEALESVTDFPFEIFYYFSSLYIFSAILGLCLHKLIRYLKLDINTRIFRFKNEWYYLLSGEYQEFINENILWKVVMNPRQALGDTFNYFKNKEKIDETENSDVWLSTVIHHDDKIYLYRGIVSDFYFDKVGELDKVVLSFTHRRLLDKDRTHETPKPEVPGDRYYAIDGEFFVIKYSDMVTINLNYFKVPEIENIENIK